MTAQTTPSVSSIPSYLSMVSVHMMKTEFVNFGPENPITQTLDVSDLVLTGQLFFKAYSFSLHPVMLTKFHDYILQTEEVTSSSTQLDHKFRSPSMHRTALFNSIQNVFFFFFSECFEVNTLRYFPRLLDFPFYSHPPPFPCWEMCWCINMLPSPLRT